MVLGGGEWWAKEVRKRRKTKESVLIRGCLLSFCRVPVFDSQIRNASLSWSGSAHLGLNYAGAHGDNIRRRIFWVLFLFFFTSADRSLFSPASYKGNSKPEWTTSRTVRHELQDCFEWVQL